MVVIHSDSYGELHIRNKLIIGTKEGEIFCGIR